ncbi:SAGA complex subunit [Martiniozyma asiatica (nom. inval.)]|nr:SAGA complex subunit [Martiniozyma asiatica]
MSGKTIIDISPTVAIASSSPIHSFCFSKGPKWLFTGGEDGFIRKFNLFSSLRGQAPLTVAQRHLLVDTISLGGAYEGYWENEIPMYRSEAGLSSETMPPGAASARQKNNQPYTPKISQGYSLACDENGFWLLSGLENGGISLQSTRMNEGAVQWYFRDSASLATSHKKSTITLTTRTNSCITPWIGYQGDAHSSTVSCLTLDYNQKSFLSGSWDQKCLWWDLDTGKVKGRYYTRGQVSTVEWRPIGLEDCLIEANVSTSNIEKEHKISDDKTKEMQDNDDMDSLFGSEDENDPLANSTTDIKIENDNKKQDEIITKTVTSASTFLTSTINGAINLWDNRTSSSVMSPGSESITEVAKHGEPWCMKATWGHDGNTIWMGRRRATVEQWDIRKPEQTPYRSLKLPSASGNISCVTRHGSRYLFIGGEDNIRLYDLEFQEREGEKDRKVPFMIVPTHVSGFISDMRVDESGKFLVSANGGRGWGNGGEYAFVYEIVSV